ncbi:MAG: DUF4923 family protein [Prevotella sp.]|jgi:hypothetical protein|nr:DUF4923 family protein [Prevotella sp.]
MKNFFVKSVVLGAILMTSLSASAQIDLGNLGKVVSSAIGGEAGSIISSKNNVSKENIVGTWTYKQPSISFESNDLLKQAGGQLTSAAIEKKLAEQFTKVGITAGKFLITFGSDNTFSTIKNGVVTTSGTYVLNGSKITFSYLENSAKITGYAQMKNGLLSISFDSSKVLDVMSKMSKYSANTTLSTISSLAGSFNGMKTGVALSKYVAPVAKKTTTAPKKTTVKKTTVKSTTKVKK